MADFGQIRTSDLTRNVAARWDEPHRYTPTARHRRRLLLDILADLEFADCLDAGCAQPYLLQEIARRCGAHGYGCDLSEQVVASNRERCPECQFAVVDLEHGVWPDGRQFDLVVCSEVLEHILDWETALQNLVRMSRNYLLITVPGGKRRRTDIRLGHHRHYNGTELLAGLVEAGCQILVFRRWGFPVQALYKLLINAMGPDRLFDAFCSDGRKYTLIQKLIAHSLYGLFFINDLFQTGDWLVVLACKNKGSAPDGFLVEP